MKRKPRIDYVELPIETEFDFEPPERETGPTYDCGGTPGSPGGAYLTGATLVFLCSGVLRADKICTQCGRFYPNGKLGDACGAQRRLDVYDALTAKQKEALEEAYFIEMTEHDDPPEPDYEPPDPEPDYTPKDREEW